MGERLSARLAPFRHRHFRNLFLAQTLSLVGTWSHDLARSWIIVSATGSSGALGNINLAIAVPCLFLILQGGVMVDRTDVRRLIRRTKSALGISALVLACIAEFSEVQIWHLLIFGLIEGMIVSFDQPAFAALTVRIVPKRDFQQAIALNSTNFHTSRMLGPIVAAWLMTIHGPSFVFFFDALSYFGVAWVLSHMEFTHVPLMPEAPRAQLRDGLRYIFRHPRLRYRVMQLMLAIGCIYPMMNAVFRAYVQQKFNLNAHEFGTVFSLPAFGSLCGALSFAVIKPHRPIRAIYYGIPLVTLSLLILPFIDNLSATTALMSLAGFGVYLSFASLTVSMQLEVEESYRGRLSSVIGLGFAAIGPLMCFPWGHLADSIGAPITIVSAALFFGLGSAFLALVNRRVE
jgi:MFS family permease